MTSSKPDRHTHERQHTTMTQFSRFAVAATAVAMVFGLAQPALASTAEKAATPEQHCVVEVIAERDGVLITGNEICFAREADARSHSDSRSSGTLGTHYTSTNYNGSSITITGSGCSGLVWYPTGSWNNNIESSLHQCGGGNTTFYDSSNCSTGPYAISSDRFSLGSMNNRASCVRYG